MRSRGPYDHPEIPNRDEFLDAIYGMRHTRFEFGQNGHAACVLCGKMFMASSASWAIDAKLLQDHVEAHWQSVDHAVVPAFLAALEMGVDTDQAISQFFGFPMYDGRPFWAYWKLEGGK